MVKRKVNIPEIVWDEENQTAVKYKDVITENFIAKNMVPSFKGNGYPVFVENTDSSFVEDVRLIRWGSMNVDKKISEIVCGLENSGISVYGKSGHCFDCKTYLISKDSRTPAFAVYTKPKVDRFEHGYIEFHKCKPAIVKSLEEKKIELQPSSESYDLNDKFLLEDGTYFKVTYSTKKDLIVHFYYLRTPAAQDKAIEKVKELLSPFMEELESINLAEETAAGRIVEISDSAKEHLRFDCETKVYVRAENLEASRDYELKDWNGIGIDSRICDLIGKINEQGYKTAFCCSGHLLAKKAYIDEGTKKVFCMLEKDPVENSKLFDFKSGGYQIGYIAFANNYKDISEQLDINDKRIELYLPFKKEKYIHKKFWKKNFKRKNINLKNYWQNFCNASEPYVYAEQHIAKDITNLFKKNKKAYVNHLVIRFFYQLNVESQKKAIEQVEKLFEK